jgi:hypothetical protein
LRIFQEGFGATAGSIGVRWAKGRVDEFLGLVGRKKSCVERGGEVWGECVQSVGEQVGVLGEVAVDFRGVVQRGLEEEVQ